MKFDMSELTRDVFAKRNLVSDLKKMIEADRQEEQDPEKKEEIRRPADEYIVKIDVSRFRIMDERASEFEKFKSMDHNADNSSSYVEYYNSDPARNLRFGNTYVYMDVFVVEKSPYVGQVPEGTVSGRGLQGRRYPWVLFQQRDA